MNTPEFVKAGMKCQQQQFLLPVLQLETRWTKKGKTDVRGTSVPQPLDQLTLAQACRS